MALFLPSLYVLVPGTATVLAVLLAYLAWSRRPAPGSVPFTAVFLAASVWSFAYTMELLSADAAGTLFWGRVTYLGIVALPTAWLLFALAYTGRDDWRSPPVIGVLLVEPLLVLAAVWGYPDIGLVWVDVIPSGFEGIVVNRYEYGALFYAAVAYSYLLFLVGAGLLVRQLRRVPTNQQARIGALLAGALLPGIGNALFNAGLSPSPPLNLTHIGFSLGGVLFFWAFYRHGHVDFPSVARGRTFELVDTPVAIVDEGRRVVDLNPAAESLFGVPGKAVAGQPLDSLLPTDQPVFARTGDRIYNDEVVLDVDGEPRRFRVDVATVYYPIQQGVMGQVVQLLEEPAG
ncbi:MAG: histidine kinase N-terminal 7TM domain-containing protein [Halobacteriales archaeon]|nr:histidine kinase N-terminal 7TM domain-containing protein [Halobacteriales archaeon]